MLLSSDHVTYPHVTVFFRQRITKLHFKEKTFELRVVGKNVSSYWLTDAYSSHTLIPVFSFAMLIMMVIIILMLPVYKFR